MNITFDYNDINKSITEYFINEPHLLITDVQILYECEWVKGIIVEKKEEYTFKKENTELNNLIIKLLELPKHQPNSKMEYKYDKSVLTNYKQMPDYESRQFKIGFWIGKNKVIEILKEIGTHQKRVNKSNSLNNYIKTIKKEMFSFEELINLAENYAQSVKNGYDKDFRSYYKRVIK